MRTTATRLACIALAATLATSLRTAPAQETIILEEATSAGTAAEPGACGCRPQMDPPWHASVAGDPCGPSCPPPNLFHANPCGQLWMKHTARQQGLVPPPCFPRMHGRLADGWWPTPRPITLPRCPNCGAHIDAGL